MKRENVKSETMSLIKIKVKSVNGCYHREHSPEAYKIIDNYIAQHQDRNIIFEEHESGPEIIALLNFGKAGLELARSVIDLITTVINARIKGRERGDDRRGELLLVIKNTHITADLTYETVMEIYNNDVVTSEQVQAAIEHGLNKSIRNEEPSQDKPF